IAWVKLSHTNTRPPDLDTQTPLGDTINLNVPPRKRPMDARKTGVDDAILSRNIRRTDGRTDIRTKILNRQKMKVNFQLYVEIERTRDLLFSGSKRSFEVPKDANCNDIYVRDDIAMDDQMEECPRQLHITPSGQLANMASENKPTNAFDALMNARRATGVSSCQCCKGQAASQSRCGFCDKSICYDCVRPSMRK
ncbi:hypothetical protein MAR_001632, partial [Mya arenaria]